MSNKLIADKKAVALKTKRDSLAVTPKRSLQPAAKQKSPAASPVDVLLDDNCSTTIQVTVKTKGRKRTSTMVSGSPTSQKAIEEKKKPDDDVATHQNWSSILREQNRLALRHGLQNTMQRYGARPQGVTSRRQSSSDSKETRKSVDIRRSQRYGLGVAGKHPDEIPTRQEPANRKASEYARTVSAPLMPSSTSMASSMESVVVVDRGVQCGGVFDCLNDRFGVCNPVRTLFFLVKELEERARDERSIKILAEMEQALSRVPMEPGEFISEDVDSIALRAQLEASVAQLDATCTKLNATCTTLREQRDSLQRQVQRQSSLLEEARIRESDLTDEAKKLQSKFEEASGSLTIARKTIDELKDDNGKTEQLQKMVTDLRTELNKQTDLSQQRFMEAQYLKLEKEKLLVLSSYKDSQLVEHRAAVKELQNFITDQLTGLRVANKESDATASHHISVLQGGLACSSPTRTCSERSNSVPSWHGMSDASISTVDPNAVESPMKAIIPGRRKNSSSEAEMAGDSDRRGETEETRAQLEFVSLPGGETSRTLSPTVTKPEETKRTRNQSEANPSESPDAEKHASTDSETLLAAKSNEPKRSVYRSKRKDLDESKKRRSSSDHSRTKSVVRDSSRPNGQTKEFSHANPIDVTIKEQFQNIFKDTRQQTFFPVNVPSPPRLYPHPDWSDSSLPSISGISESNVV